MIFKKSKLMFLLLKESLTIKLYKKYLVIPHPMQGVIDKIIEGPSNSSASLKAWIVCYKLAPIATDATYTFP